MVSLSCMWLCTYTIHLWLLLGLDTCVILVFPLTEYFIYYFILNQVLQEQYGPEGIAQHGMEVLLATLSKIYIELQDAYKG